MPVSFTKVTFQAYERLTSTKLNQLVDNIEAAFQNCVNVNGDTLNGPLNLNGNEIQNAIIYYLLNRSANVSIGTDNAYGSAWETTTGYSKAALLPLCYIITISGIGTDETITVKIVHTFSDGTTAYIEKSYTADGTYVINVSDMSNIWKHGTYITKIEVYAKSNLSSTSATCNVRILGLYI